MAKRAGSKASEAGVRRQNGTFKKGVSGNPTGLKKTDAAAPHNPQPSWRTDSWQNPSTGMGMPGVDKTIGTAFFPDFLNFDQLQNLYRGDDLAAHVVEKKIKDGFREGWELVIADDDGKARATEVMRKCKELGVDPYLKQAACAENAYGGAAVIIGADDGRGDLTTPLDLRRVRKLDWITPMEAREIIPVYGYAEPRAPKYGEAELYQVMSRAVLPPRGGMGFPPTMWVHASRLLVFPGIRVSRYQTTMGMAGWGDSVLARVYRVLANYNSAWNGTTALLADFNQAVMKINELWDSLTNDASGGFSDRLGAMAYARSILNMMVIDGEDTFERQSTSLAGLPDTLREFMIRLCAAADMPATVLFGMSPAGLNATGDSDLALWYDRVHAWQKDKILPLLEKLIPIIFRVTGDGTEPPAWHIKFHKLQQESPKDQAQTRLFIAQADDIQIKNGTLDPSEVSASRYGGAEFSTETAIDPTMQEQRVQLGQLKMARKIEQALVPYTPPPPPGSAGALPAPGTPGSAAAPDPSTPPDPTVEVEE